MARPVYASQTATISTPGTCWAASINCCARAPVPITPTATRSLAATGPAPRAVPADTAAAALVSTVCFMKSRLFMVNLVGVLSGAFRGCCNRQRLRTT